MKKNFAVITLLAGAVTGFSQGQVDWGDYDNTDFQITIWSPQAGTAEFTEVQGNSPADFGTGLLMTGPDIPSGTQTSYTGVPLGGSVTGSVSLTNYANGNLWSVQLFAAPGADVPAYLLAPVPGAVANLSTIAGDQGLYELTGDAVVAFPDVPPDGTVTLQLRAWYNGSNAYPNYTTALNAGQPTGQSTTGSEAIGGDVFVPPDLPGSGNLGVSGGITSFSLVMPSGASNLTDVAFTSAAVTAKTGFAATGATPNDLWNTYVLNAGSLPNLETADGTASGAGLTIANASEAATNGSADPMYGSFLYMNGVSMTVTVTNLSQGVYDFYLYGHGNQNDENSVFQLLSGVQSYGTKATTNGSGWLSSDWQEGVQYVRFAGVGVSSGQAITISVEPGAGGYAVLSGLQMMQVGPMPVFIAQPTNQTVVEGATAMFSAVASGAPPLTYQWLFDSADISGATNSSYGITDAQLADIGNYSVIVTNSYGSVTSLIATLSVTAPIADLIDVAFTGASVTGKTGLAATGVSTNDFWNTYDPFPSISTLKLDFVDGTASGAVLTIAQPLAGADQNGASDPMYGTYVFGYNISVWITNLAAGAYDFYLYGHGKEDDQNSVFQLKAGSQSYGAEATTNGPGWLSSLWQEGVQYVVFTSVNVSAGQIITITVEPGTSPNFATLSGLQIAKSGLLPFIVCQSTNQEVVAGASATFSVVAGGAPPLAYQWLLNDAAISGATNRIYTVAAALPADAGNYSVIVSNQFGVAISQAVTLTVSNILILTPPADQVVLQGTAATLSVAATGAAPLSYQWLFNDAAIFGATNSSYTVTNAQPTNDGDYSVILTDAYGSLASATAILSVTNILILTQPESQLVYQDEGVTFTVEATGPAPLEYQWLFNDAAISGGTKSTFSVASAQPADAGLYSVIVMNSHGSLTSQVVSLTVDALIISTQPESQAAMSGGNATFKIVAIAGTPLTYQWLFNNTAISGATKSSYTVTSAQPADVGGYSVLVTDSYGSIISAVAQLTLAAPLIDIAFTGATATGKSGFAAIGINSKDFWNTYDVVNTSELPNLKFVDDALSGAELIESNVYSVSNNGASDPMYGIYAWASWDIILTVTNLPDGVYDFYIYGHGNGANQNGVYQITVGSENYGTQSTITGLDWSSSQWQEGAQYVLFTNVTVFAGQTVTITVKPEEENAPAVLSGLQIVHSGPLPNNPFILSQPMDQQVLQGASATFNVVVTGPTPLSYQWLLNNDAISGATNAAYSVTNVEAADAGLYLVVVTNAYGSVTSTVVTLTLIVPVIDVAFAGVEQTAKTGFAATGVTASDFWNTYDVINTSDLSNLKFVDGAQSGAGLAETGVYFYVPGNGSSDPMYGVYVFGYSNIVLTVTNLIPGQYDFYLYGHGDVADQTGVYQLTAGSHNYGTEATTNGPGWSSSDWQEGVQYVKFRDVIVQAGETVTITVELGSSTFAVISGLQIVPSDNPFLLSQPTNQAVSAGATVTFAIVAGGTAPLEYQWLFDNTDISGATNSTCSMTNAEPTDAGTYSVIVTNAYGSVTSQVATLTVTNISILTQPASQSVYQGASATFTVVASAGTPLAYQWLFNNAGISGATNSSYSLPSAQPADIGDYSVIVANVYGSLTSQVATLTVTNISILTQPMSQLVYQGASATFNVVAAAGTPVSYQWLFDNTALSGATTSSYNVTSAQPANAGNYSVILTDAYGSLTSQVAALAVTNISILTQPMSQSVLQGASATFSVLAAAGTPLAYQWLFNNTVISGSTDSNCSVVNAQFGNAGNYAVIVSDVYGSVTSAPVALKVIVPTDIDVAFTGAAVTAKTGFAATGTTTNDFWNTYDVVTTSDLPNLKFVEGAASGAGLAEVNVYSVNGNGSSDPMYGVYVYASGNIILTLTNLPLGDYDFFLYGHGNADNQNGVYQLMAGSQNYGTEATTNGPGWLSLVWQEGVQYVVFRDVSVQAGQTVAITVEPGGGGDAVLSGLQIAPSSPIPNIAIQPLSQEIDPGGDATFRIVAGGEAPLVYQWVFDTADIPGATNSSYSVTNAQHGDDGQYSVVVTNSYGSVTSLIAVLSISNIAIISQPESQLAYQGGSATFSVGAATTAPLAYQWFFDNTNIPDATNSSIGLGDVQPPDAGNYFVVLTNIYGSLTSQVVALTVTNISIVIQPTNQVLFNGESSILDVVANAGTPLVYQWFFDSAEISGATNSSYIVPNAQPADSGDYFIVLTNIYGSLTSAVATLTVLNSSTPGSIINVAFTDGKVTSKLGLAAAEGTTNDFWNTCAASLYPGPGYGTGAATGLEFADGSVSGSGITIAGVDSFYGNGVPDPMYGVYLVNANRAITVTITNLIPGDFNFYLYGHGSADDQSGVFQLTVGSMNYGIEGTTTASGWDSTAWQDGAQYVVFTNVIVAAGQAVTITVLPGGGGYALIAGLQIAVPGSGTPQITSPASSVVGSGRVEVTVGTAVVMAGQVASVPVTLLTSVGLTNLSFSLTSPAGFFKNWAVHSTNSAIGSATAGKTITSEPQFIFGVHSGQALQGSSVIGSISLDTWPGDSAFVPLFVTNLRVMAADSSSPTNLLAQNGRVTVIGPQPLLDAMLDTDLNPMLTLYGHPGLRYTLLSTTNFLERSSWSTVGNFTLTGLFQDIRLTGASKQMQFFRAVQH